MPTRPTVYLRSIEDTGLKSALLSFAHSFKVCEINNGLKWMDDSSLDIFFGSWKDRNLDHHNVKRNIVKNSTNFLVLETPLLGRQKVELVMRDNWFRLGHNGFLANTGDFNNKNCPSDRWEIISEELDLELHKDSQKQNGPIVLALQLPGDASMQGTDISQWAAQTVDHIRAVTKRPIVIRSPQLPRQYDRWCMERIARHENIQWQEGTKENLQHTLQSAWCAVTFSSGLGIDALMYGCPVIACSPASFVYDLCPNNVEYIESIRLPVREQLFYNLSYAQWSIEELTNGTAKEHFSHLIGKC
jgi:hypothetical protein